MKLTTYLTILPFLALAGCGSSVPECNDSDVTDTVLSIILTEVRQSNFATMAAKDGIYDELNYEKAVQKQDDNPLLKTVVEKVEDKYPEGKMELDAIRTTEINEALVSTSCAARLLIANGNEVDITYSAQETDDGEVWIEVYGL
ncbi:hypothetical protein [Litoribrevibacter albus]|uniref:DUF3887 domain-containing protein n=1 Tax=Litoribrevibacter albus TaxID=1473156 RepID=A0AA37SF11_9GAMM|nr:hypothetical protein [Litoribrevibacter albus]GLQ33317.1 hypothetical protein GCM10007876_37970 [Litoribrevibacter albus]